MLGFARFYYGALLVALLLGGCGKGSDEKQPGEKLEGAGREREAAGVAMEKALEPGGQGLDEPTQNLEKAVHKSEEALAGGKAIEAVDFRKLKELLPAGLPGMKRTDAQGSKNAALGFSLSTAAGTYEGEKGENIRVAITDLGSTSPQVAQGMVAWSLLDSQQETDDGYEKTTTISGHRAFERYDNKNKSGQIQLYVGGRFVVETEGSEVSMEAIKGALSKLDLAKLQGLK